MINSIRIVLVPPWTAISPGRVVAVWPGPYSTEAWIPGSSVTPCRDAPGATERLLLGRRRVPCSRDRRATSTGFMDFGDFQWRSPEARPRREHPRGWLGGHRVLWQKVHATQGGVREGLPFRRARRGPWQGNSATRVPCVSDNACKQMSCCILRKRC